MRRSPISNAVAEEEDINLILMQLGGYVKL